MVSRFRIKREREYPLPHNSYSAFMVSLDSVTYSTNWPILLQDEAKLPASVFTNPEHASFAEYNGPNCSSASTVNSIFTEIRFTLTKGAVQTDGLQALRMAFMPIMTAFEDLEVKDELTSVTTGGVLEMTSETTDRQAYPIWTGTDLPVKYTASSNLGADVPDAAAAAQETIVFDVDLWYDAINYYTISNKLRKMTTGLRWLTLTPNNPTRRILIRQTSKTKRMNPYTYAGCILHFPVAGSKYQIPPAADTSAVNHINVEQQTRFLEWNDMFHAERA